MVDKLQYTSGNSASTTLSSGVASTDTSAPLTADTNFSAKSGEGMVIIDEGTSTEEFAYATGKSGGSLTIPLANRGLEGGSAQTHASGASVKGILTAGMWNNLIDALALIIDKTTGAIKSGISFTGANLVSPVITKRIVTTTNDSTAVIDCDVTDEYQLSAVANATEFTITGTPTDGQTIIIRFKDAGVAKALTFTGITAIGVTLPTTTTAGKWGYVGIKYNAAASAWHALAVGSES